MSQKKNGAQRTRVTQKEKNREKHGHLAAGKLQIHINKESDPTKRAELEEIMKEIIKLLAYQDALPQKQ